MPLLQFDTTLSLTADEKTALADRATESYTTEMATTQGHVAVTIRERESANLHLGRARSTGRSSSSTRRFGRVDRSIGIARSHSRRSPTSARRSTCPTRT